ncbi:hypothetical protein VPH35_032297 [Triticum aestivum]
MAIGDSRWWDFSTDVLVEILLRLPPSSRRRFRLICRLWRDLISERTTEMQSRAMALIWNPYDSIAYVVDDLSSSSTGSSKVLWSADIDERGLQLVGTCNGLLCLCNNQERLGGALTLFNPATGEALALPPMPYAGLFSESSHWRNWNETYTFAHHPTSGWYKLLRVPCIFDRVFEPEAVHVLTLGEASWRKVLTGINGWAGCRLGPGIVSIDGTTYWVTRDAPPRVVSFDLDHERITSTAQLPQLPACSDEAARYHLTKVHGSLGVAIRDGDLLGMETTHVWVLDKGRRWNRRYKFSQRSIPRPNFLYGKYVLTLRDSSIYGHYPSTGDSTSDVVSVSHTDQGTLITVAGNYIARRNHTFVYVETMEPLAAYKVTSD